MRRWPCCSGLLPTPRGLLCGSSRSLASVELRLQGPLQGHGSCKWPSARGSMAPGLQGAVQPRVPPPRPVVALCALRALPPSALPADRINARGKSRKHPRPGIARGCLPQAAPSPTAASRPDSDERISLATASFGLPGYRAASPLSWHLGKLLVCVICWGQGKWVGFSALERQACARFLQARS